MTRIRFFILSVLFIVTVGSVVNLFSMRSAIAETEAEIASINRQIVEQKLRNEEYRDILADANTDDFYRDVAENELGYASRDEKIYIDISGH